MRYLRSGPIQKYFYENNVLYNELSFNNDLRNKEIYAVILFAAEVNYHKLNNIESDVDDVMRKVK